MTESLAVPPGTPAPSRHPDAPAPGTLLPPPPPHYAFCYGCGDRHPAGLHVRVTAGEGVRVTAEFKVDELHEGAPGLAHGGVLAAALDEVLGYLAWMLREPTVTARLETRFGRPVPVGSRVHIAAECLGVSGRKVFGRATGRLGSPDGELAVQAEALLITVPPSRFPTLRWADVPPRHGGPDPGQSAAGDRRAGGAR